MTKKIIKDLVIGVDIGGTKVKIVLMRGNKVLSEEKYLVKGLKTPRQFLVTLFSHIELMMKPYKKSRFIGIGVGLPAVLDSRRTKVLIPPNLPVIKKINFRKTLRDKFNLPVKLENDTNAMALGESFFGAGKDKKSMVFISLGTGVGGGIILQSNSKKELLTGFNGAANEIGHMIINFHGVDTRPKKKGELEQYASAKYISRRSSKHPLKLQKEAMQGNKTAIKIYEELGQYLGYGIANIVNVIDPEIIVLGGGISNAYKLFIKTTKETMKKYILSPKSRNVVITKSKLKDRAGAMGAAALFKVNG